MKIAVVSGKGGTGKTTVSISLANALAVSRNIDLLDCDIEEPNIKEFINFNSKKTISVNRKYPKFNDSKCIKCGLCVQQCKFNALALIKNKLLFFDDLCRGCGVCNYLCPQNAITEIKKEIGKIYQIENQNLKIKIGELSLKQQFGNGIINKLKDISKFNHIQILDSSPGTSTLVFESIYKSDFCIIVTEPTIFGLTDLKTIIESIKLVKIPFGIIINKYNPLQAKIIENFTEKNNYNILMQIDFDKQFAIEYSKGKTLLNYNKKYYTKFRNLYKKIIGLTK